MTNERISDTKLQRLITGDDVLWPQLVRPVLDEVRAYRELVTRLRERLASERENVRGGDVEAFIVAETLEWALRDTPPEPAPKPVRVERCGRCGRVPSACTCGLGGFLRITPPPGTPRGWHCWHCQRDERDELGAKLGDQRPCEHCGGSAKCYMAASD